MHVNNIFEGPNMAHIPGGRKKWQSLNSRALRMRKNFPQCFQYAGRSGIAILLVFVVSLMAGQGEATANQELAPLHALNSNEQTKTEIYAYVEIDATDAAQSSLLQRVETSFAWNASQGRWVTNSETINFAARPANSAAVSRSSIYKPMEEAVLNRIYKSPVFTAQNVQKYRIYYSVPNGFEIMHRPAGSKDSFRPGSILESDVFGAEAFEIVVARVGETGSLPGCVTPVESSTGDMRFSLGYLPNGKSAGYVSFSPEVPYGYNYAIVGSDIVAEYVTGRGLSMAWLKSAALSEQVEVISVDIPEFSAGTIHQPKTYGLRQVIAPQAIVDVKMETSVAGAITLVARYYHPSQKGSRLVSEGSLVYPVGQGPFSIIGDPFITYKITHSVSDAGNGARAQSVKVVRNAGSTIEACSIEYMDDYSMSAGSVSYDPFFTLCGMCVGAGGSYNDITCGFCSGWGYTSQWVSQQCPECKGSGEICAAWMDKAEECYKCWGYGSIFDVENTVCGWCRGAGVDNSIDPWLECSSCNGSGGWWDYVPWVIEPSVTPATRFIVTVNGFGQKSSTVVNSSNYPANTSEMQGAWPNCEVTSSIITSNASSQTRRYYAALPAFGFDMPLVNRQPDVKSQKLMAINAGVGAGTLVTRFGYYSETGFGGMTSVTHHGRMKWRSMPDGSWEMLDYSTDVGSLGRATKIVTPWLDTNMPGDLPSGDAEAGYRITTISYTADWEGVNRLPGEIIRTANGVRTGHTLHTYQSGSANNQPLWIAETWVYTSPSTDNNNSAALHTITKTFEGAEVDGWLRDLPYSMQAADRTKHSFVYHRGNIDGSGGFTKNLNGGAFRSVVIKGTARTDAGGTYLNLYDGTNIDPLYVVSRRSTAEVTIRDENANTIRTETFLFADGNWVQIGHADMAYNHAGNLVRKTTSKGDLYEAEYTNVNNGNPSFNGVQFDNSGIYTGRKQYERDSTGRVHFYKYGANGRIVEHHAEQAGIGYDAYISGAEWRYAYDESGRMIAEGTLGLSVWDIENRPDWYVSSLNDSGINHQENSLMRFQLYDKAGCLVTRYADGMITNFSYTIVDGQIRGSQETYPDGSTKIVERHRDGTLKQETGSAVVPTYHEYAIENGCESVTVRAGSGPGARWSSRLLDWAGREIRSRSIQSSGSNGYAEASRTYNAYGQLSKLSQSGAGNTLYQYDPLGALSATVLDMDGNGAISSNDRKESFVSEYRVRDGAWWYYQETLAHPSGALAAGVAVSRSWQRVTGHGGVAKPAVLPPGPDYIVSYLDVRGQCVGEMFSQDAAGNESRAVVFADKSCGVETTLAYSPDASCPDVSQSVFGYVMLSASASGVGAEYLRDHLGRIDMMTTPVPGGYVPRWNHVANYHLFSNRPTFTIDVKSGIRTYYSYDSVGRLSKTEKATNKYGTNSSHVGPGPSNEPESRVVTHYLHNTRGQLTHVWGDATNPVSYAYNNLGDRISQTTYRSFTGALAGVPPSGAGDTTTFSYYPDGMLATRTDDDGKLTSYAYDAASRVGSVTSARGITTSYSYHGSSGELLTVSHDDGLTPGVNYTYDNLGRVTQIDDASGTRSFTYRASDLRIKAECLGLDANNAATGGVYGSSLSLHYEYGIMNNAVSTLLGFDLHRQGSLSDDYSFRATRSAQTGRLATISSDAGVHSFEYREDTDFISRISNGAWSQTRTYENDRDLVKTIGTQHGADVVARYAYKYDGLCRRHEVAQAGELFAPYITNVGDEVITQHAYDTRSQLTSSVTRAGSPANPASGVALHGRDFGYAYDSMGNRTEETVNGETLAYAPNALNQYASRATSAKVPVSGSTEADVAIAVDGSTLASNERQGLYFYRDIQKNPAGGGLQGILISADNGTTIVSGTIHKFVRPVQETFQHDNDGNLVNDGLWAYTYDANNQLVRMVSHYADNTGSRVAVCFVYDYMGRRVAKRVYDASALGLIDYEACRSRRVFVYQDWTLVAEYEIPGENQPPLLARTYTWGPDIAGGTGAGGIGGLLAVKDHRQASGVYHPAQDGNGNITAMIEAGTGEIAAAYEYDGFGNTVRASGYYAKEHALRFSSKYHDAETGLAYFGYRYYSASMGRFVNRDPLMEAGGINIYAMAGNDAVGRWDFLGLNTPVYGTGPDGGMQEGGGAIMLPTYTVNGGSKGSSGGYGLGGWPGGGASDNKGFGNGYGGPAYNANGQSPPPLAAALSSGFDPSGMSAPGPLSLSYLSLTPSATPGLSLGGEPYSGLDPNVVVVNGKRKRASVSLGEMSVIEYIEDTPGKSDFVWKGSQAEADFNRRWEVERAYNQALRNLYPMPEYGGSRGQQLFAAICNNMQTSGTGNALRAWAQVGYATPYVASAPIVAIYGAPLLVAGAEALTATTTALAASPIASTTIQSIGFAAAFATRTPTGINVVQRIATSYQVAAGHMAQFAQTIFRAGPPTP